VVPQLAGRRRCLALEKPSALISRQPVPQPHSDWPHASHAADAGRQLWTQEAGVGSLVRHAANRGEPKVDRGGRIPALFEMDAVPEHDSTVEGKAGL
jgi:hypothetical protein